MPVILRYVCPKFLSCSLLSLCVFSVVDIYVDLISLHYEKDIKYYRLCSSAGTCGV